MPREPGVLGWMSDAVIVPRPEMLPALPPVLSGSYTPEIAARVEDFFHSIASIFEGWVDASPNTYGAHSAAT
jgi:hypothetical protein